MIGVYGGTFDPVHLGHIHFALDIQTALQLGNIHFIPCGVPAHRELPVASSEHRLMLLKTALQQYDEFVVDDREIQRGGVSYMIDTLQSLKQEFQDETFGLMVGSDAFMSFDSWKNWQGILDMANIIVAERPGYACNNIESSSQVAKLLADRQVMNKGEFNSSDSGRVWIEKVKPYDIASSDIRHLINNGKSYAQYLQPEVTRQIEKYNLYQS